MNDSIQAFCQGEPGSMNTEPTPVSAHQSATACRHELGAVVEADKRRRPAAFDRQAGEGADDAVGVDGVIDHDRQALSGVLVDDVQQLHLAAVDGRVELEVQRPQRVRADR